MKDPKIKADCTHWAHELDQSLLRCGPNLVLNVTQLVDVHRRGQTQRRRKDLTLTRINRSSRDSQDYVMDTMWCTTDELKEEQERQLKITARTGKNIPLNWSMHERL